MSPTLRSCVLVVTALCFGQLLASGDAAASGSGFFSYELITQTGETAPPVNGIGGDIPGLTPAYTYMCEFPSSGLNGSLGCVAINSAGDVVFIAETAPQLGTYRQSLVRWNATTKAYEVLIDYLYDPSSSELFLYNGPQLAADGSVLYGRQLTNGAEEIHVRRSDGTVVRLTDEGSGIRYASINDLGQAATVEGFTYIPCDGCFSEAGKRVSLFDSGATTAAFSVEYRPQPFFINAPTVNDLFQAVFAIETVSGASTIVRLDGNTQSAINFDIPTDIATYLGSSNRRLGFNDLGVVSFTNPYAGFGDVGIYLLDTTSGALSNPVAVGSTIQGGGTVAALTEGTAINNSNLVLFAGLEDVAGLGIRNGLFVWLPGDNIDPDGTIIPVATDTWLSGTVAVEFGGAEYPFHLGMGQFASLPQPHSINDRGEIVFRACVGGGGFGCSVSGLALIKATLAAGYTVENPVLPNPDVVLPPIPGTGTPFVFDVTGGCAITRCWYDPVVAVGYLYTMPEGAAQTFATVQIPGALPGGDDLFDLIVDGQAYALLAGTAFDLRTIVAEGVSQFTISGIDVGEGLDPTDPLAFVTGLRFLGDLDAAFQFYMYPILGGVDPCLFNVATGATLVQSAAVTGNCTLQKRGGGVLTLNQPNTHTLGTWIFDGTLQAAADNQLGDAAGILLLETGVFQALESFSTARELVVAALGGGIIVDPGKTFTHTGAMSGAGHLAKSGAGTLALAGDMGGYTGTLSVNAGKASIAGAFGGGAAVNAGELKANGTIAGPLSVAAGARFTGNAQVAGPVTNNGTVAPGNSYGAQSFLGNYSAGPSARLDMEAWLLSPLLAANGITHDTLSIAGDVSGRTLINIIPGPLPNLRDLLHSLPGSITLRGKMLVEVDGAVASNAFALTGPVKAHGFQYSLQHVRNFDGATDGFFLRARPRNELLAIASLLSASRALLANCRHGALGLNGESALGFASDVLASQVDDGTRTSQNFACTSDALSVVDTGDISLGVRSGSGTATGEIAFSEGQGRLEGDANFVQAFARVERGGFMFDVAAGYMSGEWSFDGRPVTAEGTIASADASRRFDLRPLSFLVTAGLRFDDTACGVDCLESGIANEAYLLQGRAEARLEGDFFGGALQSYLTASYAEAVSGGNAVRLEEAIVEARGASGYGDVALGAMGRVADGVTFFADVRYGQDFADADLDLVSGSVGTRIAW